MSFCARTHPQQGPNEPVYKVHPGGVQELVLVLRRGGRRWIWDEGRREYVRTSDSPKFRPARPVAKVEKVKPIVYKNNSPRLKAALAAMEGRCFYCSQKLSGRRGEGFVFDHLYPRSRGGSVVVPSCVSCDAQKGDRPPTMGECMRAFRYGVLEIFGLDGVPEGWGIS